MKKFAAAPRIPFYGNFADVEYIRRAHPAPSSSHNKRIDLNWLWGGQLGLVRAVDAALQ